MFGGRDQFVPSFSTDEHVERVDKQMRDTTELDNLQDDIRNLNGKSVTMPWKIGRPLRSSGLDPSTDTPLTPLKALDLDAIVPDAIVSKLTDELNRAVINDKISEGVLDHAENLGIPLIEQEQWWEANNRQAADNIADSEIYKDVQK
jgi:hypothetical protein